MNYPLYDMTIPVFIRGLENLQKIVRKAKRYTSRKKVNMNTLLIARLAPDMYTFVQQVQYSYFMALEAATLLSGVEMPKDFKYDEKTVTDLDRTLKRTILFLKGVKRRSFNGASLKKITTFLDPKVKIGGNVYVMTLAVPNFFFHLTTAYDILRHNGIPLTKDDYLGI